MPLTQHPLIARDGWPFMGGAVVLMVICYQLGAQLSLAIGLLAAVPATVLLVFFFLLFRDPQREVPAVPLAVVSPVDGWVTDVSPTDKGVLQGEALKVTIRVDKFGAYTARAPAEGKVLNLQDNIAAGSRLLGVSGLWIRTQESDDVVLRFRGPGGLARPRAFIRYGERIGQGQRVAYLRLARCADVYLPLRARVSVSVGDRVHSGSDILARFVHK